MSENKNIAIKVLGWLLAIVFVYVGVVKLSGNPKMLEMFVTYGLPAWLMYVVGALEVIGGLMIAFGHKICPTFPTKGAQGLILITVGAVAVHLKHDPIMMALPAFILLVLLVVFAVKSCNCCSGSKCCSSDKPCEDRDLCCSTDDESSMNAVPTNTPYSQDDLKAIEGVGPQIENLLNAAGINTWKQLSQSSEGTLTEILEKAGSHFNTHKPGTWPEQARLASQGLWEQFEEYKEVLDGGVEK